MADLSAWTQFTRHRDLPYLTRTNFRRELWHTLPWGIFAGLVEGNTSAVVVAKTFHGSELLYAIVFSTPMLANILSLVWSVVIRPRSKRRMQYAAAGGAVLAFASIALTPADWYPWGGWVFALQVAVARTFTAGLVTIRSSTWQANYPTHSRAKITGRIQSARFLMALLASLAVSLSFNERPENYRWVYPLCAAIGAASLLPLRRMRVRGEQRALRELRGAALARPAGWWAELTTGLRDAVAILREDRAFARYCTAQYFLGSANFMTDPVIGVVLAMELGKSYFTSIGLLDLLPNLVMIFSLPAWSHHFDRVGVLRFRIRNTATWTVSIALAALAIALLKHPASSPLWFGLSLLTLSRAVQGLGRGGGAIAWNIGHLHFADARRADLYMGVHVALTGVRGMIMPLVSVWLYGLMGWSVLLVGVALVGYSQWMFARLADEDDRHELRGSRAPPAVEITANLTQAEE